jgi:hypothetical protein
MTYIAPASHPHRQHSKNNKFNKLVQKQIKTNERHANYEIKACNNLIHQYPVFSRGLHARNEPQVCEEFKMAAIY